MNPTEREGIAGPEHDAALVREVKIPEGMVTLDGTLTLPHEALGVVIFAHGSGSCRRSSQSRAIARALNEAGLATLLFGLLTRDEEAMDRERGSLRSDVSLLAERLSHATEWLRGEELLQDLPVGYYGAGPAGGAALVSATADPGRATAVVLQGGRPDLAGSALHELRTPTLLIVGGEDDQGVKLNRSAMGEIETEVQLEILRGVTRGFEEAGALEELVHLSSDWFLEHFAVEADGAIEVSLQASPLRLRTNDE